MKHIPLVEVYMDHLPKYGPFLFDVYLGILPNLLPSIANKFVFFLGEFFGANAFAPPILCTCLLRGFIGKHRLLLRVLAISVLLLLAFGFLTSQLFKAMAVTEAIFVHETLMPGT